MLRTQSFPTTTTHRRRLATMCLAVALGAATVACGSDDGGSKDAGPAETNTETKAGSDTPKGAEMDPEGGRAFGVDKNAITTALESATDAKVEWDGDTVRLTFTEGSAKDLGARTSCLGATTLIGPDESAVIVYPDGEIACD